MVVEFTLTDERSDANPAAKAPYLNGPPKLTCAAANDKRRIRVSGNYGSLNPGVEDERPLSSSFMSASMPSNNGVER